MMITRTTNVAVVLLAFSLLNGESKEVEKKLTPEVHLMLGHAYPLLSSSGELQTTTFGEPPSDSRYAWGFSVIGEYSPSLFALLAREADSVSGRVYGLVGMELYDVGTGKDRDRMLDGITKIWSDVAFCHNGFKSRTEIKSLLKKVRAKNDYWAHLLVFEQIPDFKKTKLSSIPYVIDFYIEDLLDKARAAQTPPDSGKVDR